MRNINVNRLSRNPTALKKCFKHVGDSVIVLKSIKVMFPSRYVNKKLAEIGSVVKTLSIYAVLDDDGNYSVVNIPTTIELSPSKLEEVAVGNRDYFLLEFEKDDIFTTNVNLVRKEDFMHNLFDEFFIRGKVPWFMEYSDLSNIFIAAKEYAGSNIGNNPIAMEILTSLLARDPNDKDKLYRYSVNDKKDLDKIKPSFIALLNIYHTFNNTVSKIAGSYFNAGITSAIVNQSDEVTPVERILRT